ncbi:MAG: hypothetical protein LBF78_03190 [Treponema sp.]|jgi:hypothetical protein|nr:hypothetical protein [Treponema sp.]
MSGKKKRRIYELDPKTPFQRILELPDAEVLLPLKQRLIKQKNSLDIIALQEQLDAALEHLDHFVHRGSGTGTHPKPHG